MAAAEDSSEGNRTTTTDSRFQLPNEYMSNNAKISLCCRIAFALEVLSVQPNLDVLLFKGYSTVQVVDVGLDVSRGQGLHQGTGGRRRGKRLPGGSWAVQMLGQ